MIGRKLVATLFACTLTSAALAGELRIGSVLGLTGPTASTAGEGSKLVSGYLDMINAQGGIHGNTLKRVLKDDEYDPRKTPALVEEAITKDNVIALLNGVGTANTIAIMRSGVLTKYKVPLVGVFSGADAIRGPGSEMIFHTRASYTEEVMKISRVASTLGLKRVAVLYQDDGFGAGINQAIAKAAEEYQFEVINKTPYKAGETNFADHARAIIASKPQAIFLMGVPEAVIGFMKAYDAPTGAAQIYTLSFVPHQMLVKVVGNARARGVGITQVVPNPGSAALALSKEFQAFLKSPYGEGVQSNALNFETYLNVRLVVEAIRKAGPNPTSEKVAQALTTMTDYSLAGYPLSFSPTNRRGTNFLDIAVIGGSGRLHY